MSMRKFFTNSVVVSLFGVCAALAFAGMVTQSGPRHYASSSSSSSGGGTAVDGDTVSFSGTGFGTNVSASNQAFFGGTAGPVESAANGTNVKTSVTLGSGWSIPGGDATFVSTARFKSGTRSILHRYGYASATGGTFDDTKFQFSMLWDAGASYKSIYTNVYLFLTLPGVTTGQEKLQRFVGPNGVGFTDTDYPNILVNNYPGANGANESAFQIQSLAPGNTSGSMLPNILPSGPFVSNNAWVRLELFMVAGTAAGSDGTLGYRAVRADGTVLASGTTSARTFWGGTDPEFSRWVLQYIFANASNQDGAEMNVDRDAYGIVNKVTAAFPMFVYRCNASTYAASDKTTCSVQKFTAWTDTSITIVVNKGALSTLTGSYCYVMNGINSAVNSSGIACLGALMDAANDPYAFVDQELAA